MKHIFEEIKIRAIRNWPNVVGCSLLGKVPFTIKDGTLKIHIPSWIENAATKHGLIIASASVEKGVYYFTTDQYPVKKYMLFPGYVYSKNGSQRHFISAEMLISLYRVNPNDCVTYGPSMTQSFVRSRVALIPRYDGNYTLEKIQW